ncbi:MAG: c-type cytochrome [Mariniphaga sp.]|nr:c-type cytochrome [Mariniphaga sp.]
MKKRTFKFLTSSIVIFFAGMLMAAFVSPTENMAKQKEWDIPAKYKEMENPYAGDKSLEKVGEMLYMKNCRLCHGNKGEGNGPKAKLMKLEIIPFSDAKFQAHNDGEIYYMAIIGKDEMPNFEKIISDEEDRWAVINYVRTLKIE